MIRSNHSLFYFVLFLLCAFIFLGGKSKIHGQTDCYWTGGPNGVWYGAGNWTPVGIPDNTVGLFYNAFIDDDPNTDVVVIVDSPPSTLLEIDSLTLDTGDTVRLEADVTQIVIAYDAGRVNSGRLNNSGEIIVDALAGETVRISLETDSVISGGGTITLTGDGNAWFTGFPIASLNVVNVDNLIQGKGQLGGASLTLINQAGGTIDANDPTGTLLVTPRANTTFVNQGLMQASAGGELVLAANYDNQGGTIQALDNSIVTLGAGLAAADITGGILASGGTGRFEVPTGFSPELQELTITGTVNVNDSSNLRLAGAISNQSEIIVDNVGSVTRVQISGAVVLDGGGTVTLSGTTDNSQIANLNNGNLTNVDNLIQGKGLISNIQFENQATANANDATGTLLLLPIANNSFTNSGLMNASGGGNLEIRRTIENAGGIIESQDGSIISFSSATINDGVLQSSGSGSFDSISAMTNLNGVRIIPGNSVGTMNMMGDFRFGIDSVLEIEIDNAAAFDVVNVGNTLNLQGEIEIQLNGFTPSARDTLTVATANNLTGAFANVANGNQLETSDGSGKFTVNYGVSSNFDPDHVVLSDFQASVILGDLNGDGLVNLLDVSPFVAAVGSGQFIPEADINQDGVVNLLDVQPFIALLGGP